MTFVYCSVGGVLVWEHFFRYVSNIGLGVFFVFASLNVSLMWIQVARRTKHMQKAGTNVGRWRTFVLVFGTLQGLVLLITTIFGMSDIASGLTILTLVIITIIYWVGAYKLSRAARLAVRGNKKSKGASAIRRVIYTALGIGVCALIYIAGAGLYVLNYSANDGVVLAAGVQMLLFSVTGCEILILKYVRSTSKKTTKASKSTYVPDSQFTSKGGTTSSRSLTSAPSWTSKAGSVSRTSLNMGSQQKPPREKDYELAPSPVNLKQVELSEDMKLRKSREIDFETTLTPK